MTDDNETALAVRGAMWCGMGVCGLPPGQAGQLLLMGRGRLGADLLVALLAKCVALPDVTASIDTVGGYYSAYVYVGSQELEWREEPSPLLAILRALDGAGLLPEGE